MALLSPQGEKRKFIVITGGESNFGDGVGVIWKTERPTALCCDSFSIMKFKKQDLMWLNNQFS